MTVDSIFSEIASHMIKGIMIHDELCNYFDVLGLYGYRTCQEYHYLEESMSFRELNKYYIENICKLIPKTNPEFNGIIPNSVYKQNKQSFSQSEIRTSVKELFSQWVEWETETKELYEESYKSLMELGEIHISCMVIDLICDVSKELNKAKNYLLELRAVDYSIDYIIDQQKELYNKYKNKINKIKFI